MEPNNASGDVISSKFAKISPHLDEKTRRMWAANEALALRLGGINEPNGRSEPSENGRVRRAGSGRKSAAESQPGLVEALEALVESAVRGDSESPLLWVSKSCRSLEEELVRQGLKVSP